MLTLHSTAELIKKALKTLTLLTFVLIFIFILLRVGIMVKNMFFPTPLPQPEAKYGKLPSIPFPESRIQETFTYTLDTLTGKLPVFPDRTNVYTITQPTVTLLNSTNAEQKAQALSFVDEKANLLPHNRLSPTLFQWDGTFRGLNRSLKMDIITYNFDLTSDYLNDESVNNPSYYTNEKRAQQLATNLLQGIGQYPTDIDDEKTTTQLLSLENGIATPTQSLTTTNIIKVDFFQKDIDKMPIFYPYYPNSTMSFLVSIEGLDQNSVVEAKYYHHDITTEKSTYGIKTAEEAFDELKNGKAYIANYFGAQKTIKITDVFLGYYLGEMLQPYLQPIIVFIGEGDFYAYVPAIESE